MRNETQRKRITDINLSFTHKTGVLVLILVFLLRTDPHSQKWLTYFLHCAKQRKGTSKTKCTHERVLLFSYKYTNDAANKECVFWWSISVCRRPSIVWLIVVMRRRKKIKYNRCVVVLYILLSMFFSCKPKRMQLMKSKIDWNRANLFVNGKLSPWIDIACNPSNVNTPTIQANCKQREAFCWMDYTDHIFIWNVSTTSVVQEK